MERDNATRFQAIVKFPDPFSAKAAIAPLNQAGFDVEVLPWIDTIPPADPDSNNTFIWFAVCCPPGRDDNELRAKVEAIVEPLCGDEGVYGSGTTNKPIEREREQVFEAPRELELLREVELERRRAGIFKVAYPGARRARS
jgi:hypothetical protein